MTDEGFSSNGGGSPGGNPHADRRNWQPAATPHEYLANCREGLETYSERRLAKLWGKPRIELQRWQLMAEIPEDLFERLLASRVVSTKMLAAVGLALKRGRRTAYAEHCPHCGHVLRVRGDFPEKVLAVVNQWLADRSSAAGC